VYKYCWLLLKWRRILLYSNGWQIAISSYCNISLSANENLWEESGWWQEYLSTAAAAAAADDDDDNDDDNDSDGASHDVNVHCWCWQQGDCHDACRIYGRYASWLIYHVELSFCRDRCDVFARINNRWCGEHFERCLEYSPFPGHKTRLNVALLFTARCT